MKKVIDAMLWVIGVVLVSAGLIALSGVLVADPADPRVTPRAEGVEQDRQTKGEADEKNLESQVILGDGSGRVKITSIKLKPPVGHTFRPFTEAERKGAFVYRYVDFNDLQVGDNFGVVADENGLVEGPLAIKAYGIFVDPPNAGTFPIRMEGNLTRPGLGSSAAAVHWAVGVKHVERSILRIESDPFLLRSATDILVRWDAIDGNGGSALDPVGVKIALSKEYVDNNPAPLTIADAPWPLELKRAASAPVAPQLPNPVTDQAERWVLRATHNVTGPVYDAAEVRVPIVDAHWVEREDGDRKYRGFDPTTNPPWIVVEEGTTATTAKLAYVNAEGLTVSASHPTRATVAGGDLPNTDVTGVKKNPVAGLPAPRALASKSGVGQVAQLNISVKKPRTVTVKFFLVKDNNGQPGGNAAVLTDTIADAWRDWGTRMWGPQAIIVFDYKEPVPHNVPGNLGAKPTRAQVHQAIGTTNPGTNMAHVYVLWDFVGNNHAKNGNAYIKQDGSDHAFAHEVGHAIGFIEHAESPDDLMYWLELGGKRVRKWQADVVNP